MTSQARVSLARSLYEDNTNIVLLDDPLSVVDYHGREILFEHTVVSKPWKEPPTRNRVTRHILFLPIYDKVIVINNR